nr:hypothetical protein [Methylobacterium phyllostachyos]
MSQDGGRQGYLRFGITAAGAMDPLMFATANRAVGNPLDATAVEISTGGCPKIATVIGPDLGRLAQLQGGSQIVLGAVSVADAIAARGAEAEALRREIPCEPVVRTEFAPDFLLTLNLVDGVADALVGHH